MAPLAFLAQKSLSLAKTLLKAHKEQENLCTFKEQGFCFMFSTFLEHFKLNIDVICWLTSTESQDEDVIIIMGSLSSLRAGKKLFGRKAKLFKSFTQSQRTVTWNGKRSLILAIVACQSYEPTGHCERYWTHIYPKSLSGPDPQCHPLKLTCVIYYSRHTKRETENLSVLHFNHERVVNISIN